MSRNPEIAQYVEVNKTVNKTVSEISKVPSSVQPLYREAIARGVNLLEDLYKLPVVQAFIVTTAFETNDALNALSNLEEAASLQIISSEEISQKRQELINEPLAIIEAKNTHEPEIITKRKENLITKPVVKITVNPDNTLSIGERVIKLSGKIKANQTDYSEYRLKLLGALIDNPGEWMTVSKLWNEALGETPFNKEIVRQFKVWADRYITYRRRQIVSFNGKRGPTAAYGVFNLDVKIVETDPKTKQEEPQIKLEDLDYDEAAVYLIGFLNCYRDILLENDIDVSVLDIEGEDYTLPEEKVKTRSPEELKEIRLRAVEKIREFMDDEDKLNYHFDSKPEFHPLVRISVLLLDIDKKFQIKLLRDHGTVISPLEFVSRLINAERDIHITVDRGGNFKEIRHSVVINGFDISRKSEEHQQVHSFDPRIEQELADLLAGKAVSKRFASQQEITRRIKEEERVRPQTQVQTITAEKAIRRNRVANRLTAERKTSKKDQAQEKHQVTENDLRDKIRETLNIMIKGGIANGAKREQIQAVFRYVTKSFLKNAIENNIIRESLLREGSLNREIVLRLALYHTYAYHGWGTKPFDRMFEKIFKEELRKSLEE